MESWDDEWKRAQLQLRLRDDELFHGESVTLFVDVHLPAASAAAASLPTSPTATAAARARRQRWRSACEAARVDIRVVDVPSATAPASNAKAPRSTTLFHQDAQLELVQDAALGHESPSQRDASAPTFVFRCDALVKVRSEHWNRPLKLLVGIAPTPACLGSNRTAAAAAFDMHSAPPQTLALDPSSPNFFLTDSRQHDHLLRLIRDEPSATQPLPRTVERLVRITKPLQLAIETRYLSNDRVCIVAKARNTHTHVALTVLDLHLHLNESYASSGAPTAGQRRRSQRQFRVVNDTPEQFPVRLRSAEQQNFLFMIEATHSGDSDVDSGSSSASSGDSADSASDDAGFQRNGHEPNARSVAGDAHERAASMSRRHARAAPGGPMKRHSSSGSVVHSSNSSANNCSTGQRYTSSSAALKKLAAPATAAAAAASGAMQTQQTLLTLSWEASSSDAGAQPRPITELHTIIWSPQSLSSGRSQQAPRASPTAPRLLPASAFTALVPRSDGAAGVTTVHLNAQSALSLSLAPLPSQQHGATTGDVVTLCLVIANRSRHTSFDLTLLAPFASESASGSPTGTAAQEQQLRAREPAPSWFSFEATHRLGVVPPGMTVRKSVRVVLLRFGKCDLSRFALFDRYSSTCFVPSTAALSTTSTAESEPGAGAGAAPSFVSPPASSWEVFVAH